MRVDEHARVPPACSLVRCAKEHTTHSLRFLPVHSGTRRRRSPSLRAKLSSYVAHSVAFVRTAGLHERSLVSWFIPPSRRRHKITRPAEWCPTHSEIPARHKPLRWVSRCRALNGKSSVRTIVRFTTSLPKQHSSQRAHAFQLRVDLGINYSLVATLVVSHSRYAYSCVNLSSVLRWCDGVESFHYRRQNGSLAQHLRVASSLQTKQFNRCIACVTRCTRSG